MSVIGVNGVGVRPDERGRRPDWRGASGAELREMGIKGSLRAGMTYRQIVVAWNVSPNTIARLRREMEAERAPRH